MSLEDGEDLTPRRSDPIDDSVGPDQDLAEVVARKLRNAPASKRRRRYFPGNGDQLRRPVLCGRGILVRDEVRDGVEIRERSLGPEDRVPAERSRTCSGSPWCPLSGHFVLAAKRCLIRLTTEAWEWTRPASASAMPSLTADTKRACSVSSSKARG